MSFLIQSAAGAFNTTITNGMVNIGVMTDMTGAFSGTAGQGSVIAAEMAIEDAKTNDYPYTVNLIVGDHKNDEKKALQLARLWDEKMHVDAIVDLPSSNVAIAIQLYAKERGIITLVVGAGSSSLTGKYCSPTGFHWLYDTYAIASGIGRSITYQGGDKWFLITTNNDFGRMLNRDVERAVKIAGGQVVGALFHGIDEKNFEQIFDTAKSSGANVIGLANAGSSLTTALRQAKEHGVADHSLRLAPVLAFLSDIQSRDIHALKNLEFVVPAYWALNEETKAWSQRFIERQGTAPSSIHIGVYSAVSHYLKAVKVSGFDQGRGAALSMQRIPVNDPFWKRGHVRADGRMVHNLYLVRVKKVSEIRERMDYFKVLTELPGELAFKPLRRSECPYINK